MPDVGSGEPDRDSPSKWPLLIALPAGVLLGGWIGYLDTKSCGSEAAGFGTALVTPLVVLLGAVIVIGGFIAAAVGSFRHDARTTNDGGGLVIAGFVVPVTSIVVMQIVQTFGCG